MSKDAANSAAPPPGNPVFSAVLLAGGKSSRMGYDKASALLDGQTLWWRQVSTLVATHPQELFISGKVDGPYARHGFEIIGDLHPGCGPLGGFEAACARMRTPLLCVLAIDLPWIMASFLSRLVAIAARDGRGVVPQNGDYFEPLAAVYPRALLPLVSQHLREDDHSLQRLVRRALELDLIVAYPLAEDERALFRNVNTEADLAMSASRPS